MTTWRKLITEVLADNEKFDDLTISIDDGELDREFDNGYGGSNGAPFTAWSKDRVFFPLVYDGAEWVGSVPRNPCGLRMFHQGGE